MDQQCGSCRFFVAIVEPDHALVSEGRCHRYPPSFLGGFAVVQLPDWCGEFQSKVNPINEWREDLIRRHRELQRREADSEAEEGS